MSLYKEPVIKGIYNEEIEHGDIVCNKYGQIFEYRKGMYYHNADQWELVCKKKDRKDKRFNRRINNG